MKSGFYRLVKINFVIFKGTCFHFEYALLQSMQTLPSYRHAKNADGQTALALYVSV